MNIHVGNLSYDTDAEGVRHLFAAHGVVANVKIIVDHETGRSRGFGFVEMPDEAEARRAMEAVQGQELDGRKIRVSEALPPGESRPRRTFVRY